MSTIIEYGIRALVVAALGLTLAGCQSPEQQRGQNMGADQQRCQDAGFAPGTNAMARCMSTTAATRAADRDRNAFRQTQQAKIQQQKADDDARAAAERAQDDAENDRRRREFQREFQNGGPGTGSDDDDDNTTNPPTASRIPGMVCDGTGDDATCDAR